MPLWNMLVMFIDPKSFYMIPMTLSLFLDGFVLNKHVFYVFNGSIKLYPLSFYGLFLVNDM